MSFPAGWPGVITAGSEQGAVGMIQVGVVKSDFPYVIFHFSFVIGPALSARRLDRALVPTARGGQVRFLNDGQLV